MGLLDGKKGLIVGMSNERAICCTWQTTPGMLHPYAFYLRTSAIEWLFSKHIHSSDQRF
jgi:hypothetical protein